MADDERLTWDFILEVLDVIERHGYRHSNNEHTGQAIGLIRDTARIYEGTLDAPAGGYVVVPSSQPAEAQPPGPPAVIVSAAQVKTLLATLDEAAEYKRGPGRDLRRLRRPVLHHLPVAPTGRRCLRPDGRPDEPSRRGLRRPAARPRPHGTHLQRTAPGRRPGGRTVTRHRTAPAPCPTSQRWR
jgi:hypothetical protein